MNDAYAKILIVDDDEDFSGSLADILNDQCAKTEVASSGQSAVKAVKDNSFEVVLMDIKMPDMGGLEVLKIIKDSRPGIDVLLMTGYADEAIINEALQQGAVDILYKPLDIEALIVDLKGRLKILSS